MKQKAGQITAAGKPNDVTFEQVQDEINNQIDAAYRLKYASNSYLNPMIGNRARVTTIRILPRP